MTTQKSYFQEYEAMIKHNKLNQPCSTFELFLNMVGDFLAALGLVASVALFGLYYGGFFHWAAKSLPDNAILQFFFGA